MLTTVPSARVMGVISRAKNPFSTWAHARFWLRTPKRSISSRVMPSASTTFSAVCPMAMYMSGRPVGGVHLPWPPWARAFVRSPGSLKIGFGALSLAPDM